MSRTVIPWLVVSTLVAVALVGAMQAADPQMHEGTVVSAAAGKLSIKDKAGKDQSFVVDGAAKVTVNGKPGRLEDLKESTRVQVMVDDKGKVLTVSTIDKEKGDKSKDGV